MLPGGRLPSLTSIGAFEAAARHGNFAKAARELGTTAAAVSYHVRQLERQVGAPLFRRHPHRVELNGSGTVVAQEVAEAFQLLRQSFTRLLDREQLRLRITTLPTLGTSWLTPKLGRFRETSPGVSVELDLSVEPRDLTSGDVDVAIRHGLGNWPGLDAIRLFPCIFTPLCAPAIRQRLKRIGDRGYRLEIPLLGRPDWWEIWFRRLGQGPGPQADSFGISLTAEHLDIAAAVEGHGVAIGSPILFARDIAAGRLTTVHDLVADDGQAFWLAYPRGLRTMSKIVSFRQWLLQEVQADLLSLAASPTTAGPWPRSSG